MRRQPIYEKDRLDPIAPGAKLSLDPALLAGFPEGYRHLGYLQTKAGFNVRLGLPRLRGPEVAKLYAEGAAWLGGRRSPASRCERRSVGLAVERFQEAAHDVLGSLL